MVLSCVTLKSPVCLLSILTLNGPFIKPIETSETPLVSFLQETSNESAFLRNSMLPTLDVVSILTVTCAVLAVTLPCTLCIPDIVLMAVFTSSALHTCNDAIDLSNSPICASYSLLELALRRSTLMLSRVARAYVLVLL